MLVIADCRLAIADSDCQLPITNSFVRNEIVTRSEVGWSEVCTNRS